MKILCSGILFHEGCFLCLLTSACSVTAPACCAAIAEEQTYLGRLHTTLEVGHFYVTIETPLGSFPSEQNTLLQCSYLWIMAFVIINCLRILLTVAQLITFDGKVSCHISTGFLTDCTSQTHRLEYVLTPPSVSTDACAPCHRFKSFAAPSVFYIHSYL